MKKCESCKHFRPSARGDFATGHCFNGRIVNTQNYSKRRPVQISTAREICDKEGDGHFVHFQPMEETDRGYTPADQETRQMFHEACERVNL